VHCNDVDIIDTRTHCHREQKPGVKSSENRPARQTANKVIPQVTGKIAAGFTGRKLPPQPLDFHRSEGVVCRPRGGGQCAVYHGTVDLTHCPKLDSPC